MKKSFVRSDRVCDDKSNDEERGHIGLLLGTSYLDVDIRNTQITIFSFFL